MNHLPKYIQESFVNPVIDLLPLITFIIIDNFWGLQLPMYTSLPLSIGIVVYFFIVHPHSFNWHAIASFFILSIGFLITVITDFKRDTPYRQIIAEAIAASFIFVLLLCQKPLKKLILSKTNNTIPLENNIREFLRVATLFGIAFTLHCAGFCFIRAFYSSNSALLNIYLRNSYTVLLLLLIIYESLRVRFIRNKLLHEEWWPIMNKNGDIIGSIERSASLLNATKYLHPIIRVHILHNGMVFMQKRKSDDTIYPGLWDAAISNHLTYGESVDSCIKRTIKESYGLDDIQPIFLCNYQMETCKEKQMAFLFYVDYDKELKANEKYIDTTKWWTIDQIKENLTAGIFPDNLSREFDLLTHRKIL